MAQTKIEWADVTWSPITGCSPVSEGCENCYAERMANRLKGRCGYDKDEPFKVTMHPDRLEQPLRWRKPRRIFVCSMGDLFHEDVPEEFICKVWGAMRYASNHIFMVLTKRPERMLKWFRSIQEWSEYGQGRYMIYGDSKPTSYGGKGIIVGEVKHWPLPNLWLGVTAENQARADERIPILLQIPAVVRFVSVEPMLESIQLRSYLELTTKDYYARMLPDGRMDTGYRKKIDWVICGGETGPGARPIHPDWARGLRDQCRVAGVPFFFKHWGEWESFYDRDKDDPDWRNVPEEKAGVCRLNLAGGCGFHGERVVYLRRVGKKAAGRLLDGRVWDEMP